MPIIINDFEIVVEPKPTSRDSHQGGVQQDGMSTAPLPLRPEDIEQITRRLIQRHARLHAD
jgi:hypothetical protein